MAGLIGIVVAVSQFKIGGFSSYTIRAWFSLVLVLFMFAAALTYLGVLGGRNPSGMNMPVLGYFAALLGFVVGLSLATLLPADYQFWVFWGIAIVSALGFYYILQRWQKTLQWSDGAK